MRTCVITGASSGIGRASAIMLSQTRDYDNYTLIGRNIKGLEETAQNMASDTNVCVINADLSTPENLPHIVDEIVEKYGTIDCLLNIAGYTEPASIFSTTYENIQTTYTINCFSPLILMRECAKHMKKQGGKILNVASTAGMSPRPGWVSYASSKAAMISISQTLREELAEYGIKVYCISPGRCATNLRKKLAPDEDPHTIMQPEDVARIICNLIGQGGNCIDGQNIVVRQKIK